MRMLRVAARLEIVALYLKATQLLSGARALVPTRIQGTRAIRDLTEIGVIPDRPTCDLIEAPKSL